MKFIEHASAEQQQTTIVWLLSTSKQWANMCNYIKGLHVGLALWFMFGAKAKEKG